MKDLIVLNSPSAKEKVVEDVRSDHSAARIVLLGVPDVPGVAAKVFSALAEQQVGAAMIVQNNMRGGMTDIGFLVRKERLDAAIVVCRKVAAEVGAQGVSFNTEVARVSVCGRNLGDNPEVPAKMFSALAKAGVNIEMIVSNALDITCVVAEPSASAAVEALQKAFPEDLEV
ncbi:MAG: ACT domain-containing protein [Synergistaceae bacterium]|jgi:aspartate kinase|nr:ACT domain-containing protein [Synergistaceae bacterium]